MQHTDSNDTKTHSGGILDSKVTKSSTSTGESDPVTDLGVRVLDSAVDRDTLCRTMERYCQSRCPTDREERAKACTHSTQNGGGFGRLELLRDRGDVRYPRDDVLRKGAVDGEAAVFAIGACYTRRRQLDCTTVTIGAPACLVMWRIRRGVD